MCASQTPVQCPSPSRNSASAGFKGASEHGKQYAKADHQLPGDSESTTRPEGELKGRAVEQRQEGSGELKGSPLATSEQPVRCLGRPDPRDGSLSRKARELDQTSQQREAIIPLFPLPRPPPHPCGYSSFIVLCYALVIGWKSRNIMLTRRRVFVFLCMIISLDFCSLYYIIIIN